MSQAWKCPIHGDVFTRFRDYDAHINAGNEAAVVEGWPHEAVSRSRADWEEITRRHTGPVRQCPALIDARPGDIVGCACSGACQHESCAACGRDWPCATAAKAQALLANCVIP